MIKPDKYLNCICIFSEIGNYVLNLRVTNDNEIANDTLKITVNFKAVAPLGDTLGLLTAAIVAPGDPDKSILVLRIDDLGQLRMPPLATGLIDIQAVTVIREWINGLSECP